MLTKLRIFSNYLNHYYLNIQQIGTLYKEVELVSKNWADQRCVSIMGWSIDRKCIIMLYGDERHTACISSQAGCAMGCIFCSTG